MPLQNTFFQRNLQNTFSEKFISAEYFCFREIRLWITLFSENFAEYFFQRNLLLQNTFFLQRNLTLQNTSGTSTFAEYFNNRYVAVLSLPKTLLNQDKEQISEKENQSGIAFIARWFLIWEEKRNSHIIVAFCVTICNRSIPEGWEECQREKWGEKKSWLHCVTIDS